MQVAVIDKNLKKRLIQASSVGRFIYRLPRGRRLYLTFDDGPDPGYTATLLDILERYKATASFFLVGRAVERNPELVVKQHRAGHAIGLHTHTHKTLDRMTHSEFVDEIHRNQAAIRGAIGIAPAILRPPEGRINLRSLLWSIGSGLRVIHYTHTSNDWKAESAAYIRSQIPDSDLEGGEILSFHDASSHTIEAIPSLIEACMKRGFEFHPIP